MQQLDWNSLVEGVIMLFLPGYFILQIWFGYAWPGRWRIAALVPLIVFVPPLLYSLFAFSQGSNLWPIVMIFYGPIGFLYLLLLGLARLVASRRPTRRRPLRRARPSGIERCPHERRLLGQEAVTHYPDPLRNHAHHVRAYSICSCRSRRAYTRTNACAGLKRRP
jgi:hypothetical protein